MEYIAWIGGVLGLFAFLKSNGNESRIAYLEKKIGELGKGNTTAAVTSTANNVVRPVQVVTPVNNVPSSVVAETDEPNSPALAWLRENWLMKLGVFLLLLGFVWALSYAYQARYITENGISIIGILIGVGLLGFGFNRMKLYANQGAIFMVLGNAMVIFTAYYMKQNQVIDSSIVLSAIILLTLIISSAAAVSYKRRSQSIATLVLAMITPIVLSDGSNNYLALYSYLMIIVLGTLWVVYITGWRALTLISLVFICLYSASGVISGFGIYEYSSICFAIAFSIIFFIANNYTLIHDQTLAQGDSAESNGALSDIVAAALNICMISTFVLNILGEEWHVAALLLIALVTSLSAFLVYTRIKNATPFIVYSSLAIVLLGCITFLLFEYNDVALAIAYTLEVSALVIATYILSRRLDTSEKLVALYTLPIVLILSNVSDILGYTSGSLEDYTVVGIFIAVSGATAAYLYSKREENNGSIMEKGILSVDTLLVLAIIWGLCDKFFHNAGATVALIIYAVIGICMYVYGKNKEAHGIRIIGIILIALTTLWLMTILMFMGAIYRIAGFVIIGVLMLGSAFMLKKKN